MKAFVFAAGAVALLSAPVAAASGAHEEVLVQIDYTDLDIHSASGAAVLTQRIEAAVVSACAPPTMRNIKAMAAWQACKNSALSGALEQLQNGSVAA